MDLVVIEFKGRLARFGFTYDQCAVSERFQRKGGQRMEAPAMISLERSTGPCPDVTIR